MLRFKDEMQNLHVCLKESSSQGSVSKTIYFWFHTKVVLSFQVTILLSVSLAMLVIKRFLSHYGNCVTLECGTPTENII